MSLPFPSGNITYIIFRHTLGFGQFLAYLVHAYESV